MPSFAELAGRGNLSPLMPEEFSDKILEQLQYKSAVRSAFEAIPMGRKQTRLPVLTGLATAYFPNGNTGSDTGLIPTTTTKWDNKYLNAEEIAVIVPVPISVLDDSEYDVWGRIQPQCEQAIARALDSAVLFGVNKPNSWGPSITYGINNATVMINGATKAPKITLGTAPVASGGYAEDINGAFEFVEDSGFNVNMLIAESTFKAPLRRVRNTLGERLADVQIEGQKFTVNGVPVDFTADGLWNHTAGWPRAIIGDKQQGMLGFRSDIEATVLKEAIIQDPLGRITYNLAQQNMVAIRLVCRFAWEVANTINWLQQAETLRFPFAAVTF
jgi:HK97 family phage major capsid protein